MVPLRLSLNYFSYPHHAQNHLFVSDAYNAVVMHWLQHITDEEFHEQSHEMTVFLYFFLFDRTQKPSSLTNVFWKSETAPWYRQCIWTHDRPTYIFLSIPLFLAGQLTNNQVPSKSHRGWHQASHGKFFKSYQEIHGCDSINKWDV